MTAIFEMLVNLIHRGVNPYDHFLYDADIPPNLGPDWGSEHPWFGEAIEELRPTVIVEVGSFFGRSAIHMARHLKRLELNAAIICVDTWLGNDLLWESEWRPILNFENGRPEFYSAFLRNVIEAGMGDVILPLPLDSLTAARLLFKLGVQAPFIYLDGSHVKEDVARDLELYYWSILTRGGIMLLDDYGNTTINSGVAEALHGFLNGLEVNGLKARLRKSR